MDTEFNVRKLCTTKLTFTANTLGQDFFTSYTNHGGVYPRWPSIFVLYLFYKFYGTFSQFESESIAQQLLTIGLTITNSNTFTTNSVYLFLFG